MSHQNAPSSDRLVGQVIADRYQILSVLGEGGMGRVYLAEHMRMGRKSAVKVMSPNMALSRGRDQPVQSRGGQRQPNQPSERRADL